MIAAFAALCLMAADPWTPRPGTIGLLTPPHATSAAGCAYPAGDLPVHEAPHGRPIGTLRFAAPAGPECTSPGAHIDGRDVPVLESSYEESALVVLESREGWHRIDGAGWVRPPAGHRFDTLPSLLDNGLAWLTPAWDGRLCTAPAAGCRAIARDEDDSIEWLEARRVGDRTWWRVRVTTSACGDEQPPRALGEGWIPSHGTDGTPTAWFHSRGC